MGKDRLIPVSNSIHGQVFFSVKAIGPQEIKFILVYFYDMQLENIKLPLGRLVALVRLVPLVRLVRLLLLVPLVLLVLLVLLVRLVPLLYLLYLLPECP